MSYCCVPCLPLRAHLFTPKPYEERNLGVKINELLIQSAHQAYHERIGIQAQGHASCDLFRHNM